MTEPQPIQNTHTVRRTIADSPNMNTDWYFDSIDWSLRFPSVLPFGESDVFETELEHFEANPSDANYITDIGWKIRIGKSGQLYSIILPSVGEIMPPQNFNYSTLAPWNVDSLNMSDKIILIDHHKHLHFKKFNFFLIDFS